MLLVEKSFRDFTKKEISDAKKYTEVLVALDAQSKEKVDEMLSNACKSRWVNLYEPQDHGWMYVHCFEDLGPPIGICI